MADQIRITVSEAQKIAEQKGIIVTKPTIYNWIRNNPDLGFQLGGGKVKNAPVFVNEKNFRRWLDGGS